MSTRSPAGRPSWLGAIPGLPNTHGDIVLFTCTELINTRPGRPSISFEHRAIWSPVLNNSGIACQANPTSERLDGDSMQKIRGVLPSAASGRTGPSRWPVGQPLTSSW
jgi:hypothetical protein